MNMTQSYLILIIALGILMTPAAVIAEPLVQGFLDPPDSARPWVYWFIMDGNVSREGITADLESMKAAGIGGAILMEVNVGIPRGPVEFMSDEWCALFKHAVEEAERLGLEITLNAGPGWTGSGGPWVPVEQSMQHLVASELELTGPSRFEGVLPTPEPRPPYFGAEPLTQAMAQDRQGFYADVAVLAFPRSESPRLEDIEEKALFVREPYTSKPGVKPFLPAPAFHPAVASGEGIQTHALIDLSDRLQPDGRLTWEVPEGNWTLLRFGRRTTGANTRPAPQPGLGFECDKFDRAALDAHFNAFIGKLLRTIGPRPADRKVGWTMLHIDSWEMGSQNWSREFGREFQGRRGYDPLPYLPAMTGRVVESVEVSERFLWDLRLTAQELVIENHAGYLKELGRRHGFGLSIEPYDMNPTSDLTLGGIADVPMCEFWSKGYGFDSDFTCFEATSVAHTVGRPIVAAEAFTAGSKEAWQLFPGAMKNQGDWALCAGINRFVFHRFAHQPWLDRRPGMTMGPYGVHWDRTQTWWPMVSAYHRYLARCQFLLRQGSFVADICYLVPEGAPHVFRPPQSALEGNPPDRRSYSFDGCAPETLLSHAQVENGRVAFPGGAAYRVLVLPSFDTMTPALLRKVRDLVESGAVVVGTPPLKSPSLSGFPQCDEEVLSLSLSLWGGTSPPARPTPRNLGKGRVVWGGDLLVPATGESGSSSNGHSGKDLYPNYQAIAHLLREMGVLPDFETTGPVRYAHRRTEDADLYFVANREVQVADVTCTFRVAGRKPQIWDPVTGGIRDVENSREVEGRTVIPIRFEPQQSFFVVFQEGSTAQVTHLSDRTHFGEAQLVSPLTGPWDLTFETVPGNPTRIRFESLEDWALRPEPEIRYYSGIATYRTAFELSDVGQKDSKVLLLDLGEVHNLARVRLNGKDLGVLWCAPWRLEIAGSATVGENHLEIEVANLWPNRLIGDKGLPADRQNSWTTWNPYESDSGLIPSGLIGPVRILGRE